MYILGVSALYHDSAATLIKDGEIIAAAQEERFSRIKHDSSLPENAIKFCLEYASIKTSDLSYVTFYDNSFLTLDRFMKNVLACGDDCKNLIEFSFDKIFSSKLWVKENIIRILHKVGGEGDPQFLMTKHHIAHASSAFYPSPFDKSIIVTIDGVGEWTTLSIGVGEGNRISLKQELRYPHSLGLFYSAFTWFCGFKVNSGDYKFMGLAPYGKPVYYETILKNIIDVKEDGSFRLNLDYFDYQYGRNMVNESKIAELFGGGRRMPETEITRREMDIAASIQKITEEIIIKIARHAKEQYGHDIENICIAGGCGLNCVANGKIIKENIFKNIWIQPAAGDAGASLGAALYTWYSYLGNKRILNGNDSQKGTYLGPEFDDESIKSFLDKIGGVYTKYDKDDKLAKRIATLLSDQKIIGLFEGRMEFGPRALGNRSIIADPRAEFMQSRLNMKIKFRESFRPFAPSVLKEKAEDYFELNCESPYMLLCADVKKERRFPFKLDLLLKISNENMLPVVNSKRSDIPAVTHVDYSARIQTVDGKENPFYYSILNEFNELTGCAVIVNTSFNVRGEPIVCCPKDAYTCFMRTEMDVLVMNGFLLYKEEQPEYKENNEWRLQYELD